ncbi:MAG: flagellar biosynthetic protein FliR [Sulfitobacter sp.]
MDALASLTNLSNQLLWHGFVVFLRVAAFVSLLPAFGEVSVPMRVKLGAALAFTFIVAPAAPPPPAAPDLSLLLWLSLTETTSGLLLGLGLRIFVLALQTAGAIAAQSTSLAQVLGGAAAEPLPAMGYILIIAALALVTMTGLHVKAAGLLIYSYQILPIGEFAVGAVISEWGLGRIRHAFDLAFTLAAPFVILSVLYNLALGAINKAMPQLMVAFVGAPVITAGGLLILCLAAPLMLGAWIDAMDRFIANPIRPYE